MNGGGGSARGEDGTIHKGSVSGVVWVSPSADWISGEASLQVAFYAGGSGPATVDFTVWRNGVATLLARTGGNLSATASWNTGLFADGAYELEAVVLDGVGNRVATARRSVVVQNSVVWHGGILGASETWESGRVHVVRRDLTVAGGATLTLAPGAIVKFLPGAGLTLQAGATLSTPATAARRSPSVARRPAGAMPSTRTGRRVRSPAPCRCAIRWATATRPSGRCRPSGSSRY